MKTSGDFITLSFSKIKNPLSVEPDNGFGRFDSVLLKHYPPLRPLYAGPIIMPSMAMIWRWMYLPVTLKSPGFPVLKKS
jgi:hypothetical protein